MPKGKNSALKMMRVSKERKKKTLPFYTNIYPMARGTVESFIHIEAKQPNSALRKCIKVKLNKTKEIVLAFVPYDGGSSFIKLHDIVTLSSIGGPKSRSKGDLGKALYKVIKVNNQSLRQKFLRKL